jgi:hypothetical protein
MMKLSEYMRMIYLGAYPSLINWRFLITVMNETYRVICKITDQVQKGLYGKKTKLTIFDLTFNSLTIIVI